MSLACSATPEIRPRGNKNDLLFNIAAKADETTPTYVYDDRGLKVRSGSLSAAVPENKSSERQESQSKQARLT